MTKKKVQNLLKHLVCILLCLTVILPFLYGSYKLFQE